MLQSFVLKLFVDMLYMYITFFLIFLEFQIWNAPKRLKGRAELIANCAFYTVLLRLFADMVHVCLSLGRGHVFVMSSMPSAIKVCYINFSKWALKTG